MKQKTGRVEAEWLVGVSEGGQVEGQILGVEGG